MDFLSFYWRDVLDIALVTLLLYRILLLIRGTRAFSALIGLVVLVAVYALSHFIGLYSLSWLLENLFGSLFLVIVILFHDDIRQALAAMGTQYLSWKKRPAPSNMVGDLVWVCQYFAKRRIGALIVLEGKVQLGDMMKGGVVLDARISRELLLTIFFPNTAKGALPRRGVSCRWRRWTARISVRGTAPRLALRKSAMRRSLSFQRNAAK